MDVQLLGIDKRLNLSVKVDEDVYLLLRADVYLLCKSKGVYLRMSVDPSEADKGINLRFMHKEGRLSIYLVRGRERCLSTSSC